ncbi:MAG: response regulator [Isosphaeraceae bacterium]
MTLSELTPWSGASRDLPGSQGRARALVSDKDPLGPTVASAGPGVAGEALLFFEPTERRVVAVSEGGVKLLERDRAELLGATLDELLLINWSCLGVPGEVFARFSAVARSGGILHAPRGLSIRRREGGLLPVAVNASRARRGRVPVGMLAISDRGVAGSGGLSDWTVGGDAIDRFFSLSGELCCVVGRDYCFVKVSPEWEELTGQPAEELVGQALTRWIDRDNLARARLAIRRAQAIGRGTRPARFETLVRHRDGSLRLIAWRATISGGLIYGVGRAAASGSHAPAAAVLRHAHPPTLLRSNRSIAFPSSTSPRVVGRVLVADDNAENRRVIGLMLGMAGAAVTLANDGQAALDAARAARAAGAPFELVLLDMEMPLVNGYETVRRLRDEGFSTPVVAVTAHASSEDRQDCIRCGCNDLVSKPIDWKLLLSRLADLLACERTRSAHPA